MARWSARRSTKERRPSNSVSFPGPFAARSEVTITLPAGFHDDASRALVNAASFPLKVRIDDDPPLIKFPSHFGILEANAQPVLPVSVRNVEQTLKGLQAKVAAAPQSNGKGELARIDTSNDQAIAKWINKVHGAARRRQRRAAGLRREA